LWTLANILRAFPPMESLVYWKEYKFYEGIQHILTGYFITLGFLNISLDFLICLERPDSFSYGG
jgi:hypothetical protein